MNDNTLSNRLAMVEAILGVDPPVLASCAGDPAACGDSCKVSPCPLKDNTLQHLGGLVRDVTDRLVLVRCWAEEIESLGIIPPGTWEKAAQRAHIYQMEGRLLEIQEMIRQIQENKVTGSLLNDMLQRETEITDAIQKARNS